MNVDAYQTLEYKNNKHEIELEGPFLCYRSDAWLGHGYYFWDTDISNAHYWGKKSYIRRNKAYTIAKTTINIDEYCFDLVGSVQHKLDFSESIKTLIKSGKLKSIEEAIVPNIIELMRELGLFNFKCCRAADYPSNSTTIKFNKQRNEYLNLVNRVQICVYVKKDVILPPFIVVYP